MTRSNTISFAIDALGTPDLDSRVQVCSEASPGVPWDFATAIHYYCNIQLIVMNSLFIYYTSRLLFMYIDGLAPVRFVTKYQPW